MTPLHFTTEYAFSLPCEALFDFLTDPRHEPRWNRQLRGVAELSHEPIEVGTTWVAEHEVAGRMDVLVRELERPWHAAWQVRSEFMDLEMACRLEPMTSGGCMLRTDVAVRLKGLWVLGRTVIEPAMRRDLEAKGALIERAYEEWRQEADHADGAPRQEGISGL